ncbi:hypothetical protein SAMN04488071_3070 [Kordiimonas lacus]|jgi:hypothetical protein|uniref:Uncharacterized protein n=1 Tax=Kordiimonas lacus TaxID=637679 RepID=A0A1G7DE06_9PROT|nr:hypothetical protein SAMN04488071_3070 [Kordiimonas lacus]
MKSRYIRRSGDNTAVNTPASSGTDLKKKIPHRRLESEFHAGFRRLKSLNQFLASIRVPPRLLCPANNTR